MVIPKDITHINKVIKTLKNLGFLLAKYSKPIPEIVMIIINTKVFKYGAGFDNASAGGVDGSGSSKGVIIGLSNLTSEDIKMLENVQVINIVKKTGR